MTLTVLQTTPFNFNKDEESPDLRFPELALRSYSFNIQIEDDFYVVSVTYNIWANTPQVSLYDATGATLLLNMPLIEAITDTFPNYLDNLSIFDGYYLVWDLESQAFIFSEDV